jgi:hypothetical protein
MPLLWVVGFLTNPYSQCLFLLLTLLAEFRSLPHPHSPKLVQQSIPPLLSVVDYIQCLCCSVLLCVGQGGRVQSAHEMCWLVLLGDGWVHSAHLLGVQHFTCTFGIWLVRRNGFDFSQSRHSLNLGPGWGIGKPQVRDSVPHSIQLCLVLYLLLFAKIKGRNRGFSQCRHALVVVPYWDFLFC